MNIASIICFLLVIGVLIFFHEFGHFLVAKKNGIGVTEFSIGFGPKIFSWVKNGTRFSVKCIPFGGYCLMLGAESVFPDPEAEAEEITSDEEHSFNSKSVYSRIAVIAAGPVFNFILALILSCALTAMVGVTTGKISAVADNYPAQEAGLKAGDTIVKINGKRMHFFKEISLYMTLHEGETMNIVYERNGETYETVIVPRYSEEDDRYLIGIMSSGRIENLSILQVLKYGFNDFCYNTGVVFKSLGMLFSGKAGLNDLSGPVGMAGMVDSIVTEVKEDTKDESFFVTVYWVFINLVNFAALISANLGIMNLLPIPGMDGGRLIFLIIEAIIGRPVKKKAEGIITIAGVIFLILLMVVVLFNDVRKVFFPNLF